MCRLLSPWSFSDVLIPGTPISPQSPSQLCPAWLLVRFWGADLSSDTLLTLRFGFIWLYLNISL